MSEYIECGSHVAPSLSSLALVLALVLAFDA